MADQPQIQPKAGEQFVEQKITQQTTITAGSTGTISVTVPTNGKAFLKGYGYNYFSGSTYSLRAGSFVLPSRTDQEGSVSIPVIYGNPFPVISGEKMELTILNGTAADHTYECTFYIITNRIIPTPSVGSELILSTGGGAGLAQNIVIYDSTITTSASVTAKGLQVDVQSPATFVAGTTSTTGAAAIALAGSTAIKKVDLQVDSASEDVFVGNSTSQPIRLIASQAITINIDNINKVYIKRTGTNNVTVNYVAS